MVFRTEMCFIIKKLEISKFLNVIYFGSSNAAKVIRTLFYREPRPLAEKQDGA